MPHDNPTLQVSGTVVPAIDEYNQIAIRVASAGRLQNNIKLKDIAVGCLQRSEALENLTREATGQIEAEAIFTASIGGNGTSRDDLQEELDDLLALQSPSQEDKDCIDMLEELIRRHDERFSRRAKLKRSLDLFDKYDDILSN